MDCETWRFFPRLKNKTKQKTQTQTQQYVHKVQVNESVSKIVF